MKKNVGFSFFVSDVISVVGFWLMLPGLGPNCWMEVFAQVFIGN